VWAEPGWFLEEILGAKAYRKQVEIIESVRDHAQTSVNGANGVGKDWLIGRLVCWWMAAHAAESSCKVIVTGPTYRQVADIVWREARDAFNSARKPLTGRMLPTAAKWEVGDQFFALGFSTDKPWNITGFHSPNLLVVISEAHNFDDNAVVAIKRLHPSRLVLSGNPFSQSGEFFDSHHGKRHLWNAITITATDTPNITRLEYEQDPAGGGQRIKAIEGREIVPGVVTADDVRRMAEDWGADSPFYRATVHAEFAETIDGLIPLSRLMAASMEEPDDGDTVAFGLDVAGGGQDETVLVCRQKHRVLWWRSWRLAHPEGEILAALKPYRGRIERLNYDSVGIGHNIFGDGSQLDFPAVPINVGVAARDSDRFANLKAELYWGLRMRFEAGQVVGLVDEATISQLASIRYAHNPRGQVMIESKDEMKRRGLKSPDRAEAWMLAFAYDGDGLSSTLALMQAFEGRTPMGAVTVQERDRRADMESSDNVWSKEF